MTETATTAGFTLEALEQLARGDGDSFVATQRRRAFDEFQALPLPSPETEEWRYTDVSDLLLDAFSLEGSSPRRTRSTRSPRKCKKPSARWATAPGWSSSTTRAWS